MLTNGCFPFPLAGALALAGAFPLPFLGGGSDAKELSESPPRMLSSAAEL